MTKDITVRGLTLFLQKYLLHKINIINNNSQVVLQEDKMIILTINNRTNSINKDNLQVLQSKEEEQTPLSPRSARE